MSRYTNKKRPLSCELNLGVIVEEEFEGVRSQILSKVDHRRPFRSFSESHFKSFDTKLPDTQENEQKNNGVKKKDEKEKAEPGLSEDEIPEEEESVLLSRNCNVDETGESLCEYYDYMDSDVLSQVKHGRENVERDDAIVNVEEGGEEKENETEENNEIRKNEAAEVNYDNGEEEEQEGGGEERCLQRSVSLDQGFGSLMYRRNSLNTERIAAYNRSRSKDWRSSYKKNPKRFLSREKLSFDESRSDGSNDTLNMENEIVNRLNQSNDVLSQAGKTHSNITRTYSVDNVYQNARYISPYALFPSFNETNLNGQMETKGKKSKKMKISLLSRVSSGLKSALSERDLTRLLDFSPSSPKSDSEASFTNWPTKDFWSSPGPPTRRNVNGLRQCDSLENVCDSNHDEQIENGIGLAAQPAAVNALSLPHIHRLSDYDEDNTNNDSAGENDPEPTEVVKSPNKRSDKSKKTKLKRRRAYYRTQKDVSSCEYLVVVLEYYVDPVEEFVQASRGTTLREALERRGIDVTNIQVYAEGSRSALSLNTDTYLLGGKTVRVRARDESRSPVRSRSAGTPGSQPLRKTSTSHRGGQGRFLWGGASTEDCSPLGEERANGAPTSHEGSLKASKSKQNNRWSIFPSNTKDSKMDSLVQQLDLYSRQGIPKQPHLLACQTYQIEQEVVVEDSWRTLVEGHEQLDDRQEQQQSAIWELVETEATYIHMLKVITDLFLSCLCNLQNESLLCEIDTDKLFSNIQEIYNANLTFWREHICRMLEVARSSRQPLDPTLLSDGFYKFDELFHPYTKYCLDQSHCQLYCKEKDHDNEYFKMYLAWCETQKECNRLRLMDILVQPMQRLTKYSLLLKAILKKTNLEDHKLIIQDMITHVENFVSDVNSALRHKHEQERLRDIAKRIEAYEAVEARDDELEKVVKSYSDLSLTQPMPGCPEHLPRHILHHGDLRLRDQHSSKMDVHVFLFTDLLLITKVTQRKAEKVKIIRPPYHVERLILVDLKDTTSIGLVSINEWNVAVAAFTLQCPDQRTHRTWYDSLKRAKEQYREAQQARDVMIYDDMTCVGHLAPRSPRPGSSRASRVSSLAHSHSGSIDLNEHSPASTHHPPSFDMSEIRASSASSDDSIAPAEVEIQRSKSLESGAIAPATSPRPDRRPAFPKTPNTLSVIPPYSAGQSLPNLTVESAHSLRVPNCNNPKALSPCNRGVSYPPPSPRTLRRSAPVPQSRNPPLIKTRHVTSMVGSPQDADQVDQDEFSRSGGPRRISRTDRMDNRRYHTAGAIDDIKKQDTKDATIHKRLSWNYGQGPPPSRDLGNDQGKLGRHKHAVKSVSCESMHSSSGVSSTSSLHRSMGSELETLENIDDNELEDGESTVVDLTVSDCTSLKISPHISTTYICHDSDITLGVCSQYITQPDSATEPSEGCENLVKIDVSETDPGISSVQITVTEGVTSSSSLNLSSTKDGAPKKPNNMSMREILLNDASVEASDV